MNIFTTIVVAIGMLATPEPVETRPPIELPEAEAKVVIVGQVEGKVSWYCGPNSICHKDHPPGSYVAAAGPELRKAMGGDYDVDAPQPWKGKTVHVCANTCISVTLVDWCQCYWKQPHEKLIDLYHAPWTDMGKPERVTVSW